MQHNLFFFIRCADKVPRHFRNSSEKLPSFERTSKASLTNSLDSENVRKIHETVQGGLNFTSHSKGYISRSWNETNEGWGRGGRGICRDYRAEIQHLNFNRIRIRKAPVRWLDKDEYTVMKEIGKVLVISPPSESCLERAQWGLTSKQQAICSSCFPLGNADI